ncbi:uncharacterized protein LOC116931694 [Daphnia magna]|uniref:uncharacterized protein LOC116931694 n=1 Tax=Daphnia magna TaxID=35525 RepID=UPI001E1BB05D|nr:uncharacterized protein LOC116931694 [Daphnia magna]
MYVGCDGLPSSKSTNSQFWPVLGRLKLKGAKVFDIGFYQGTSKPENANEYLHDFLTEISELMVEGFQYNGSLIKIEIEAFCCDAPALSFIKCVKPCGSYFGCSKCETQGEYVHNESGRGGRVTLPEIDAILRTDESFRSREQQTHHTGLSILENLPINMTNDFPIDPMHLVYLGAMRKLLHIWYNQRRSMKVRISKQIISEISGILEDIAKLIPVEFSRKTRSLDEVSRLKATECRLKLPYVLPVILKHRLPEEVYNHFMLLHIVIRILSCDEKVKEEDNIEYANNLLIRFVEQSPSIYGDKFVSYNIHNLIHLVDECRRLGPMETFSCFSFEIIRHILQGAHDHAVTREGKTKAWNEIHEAISLEFPDGDPKNCSQVKKKWDNLNREARAEIAQYNSSICGTGGGPEYQFQKPLHKKIFEDVIGVNNPAIANGGIEGGVESETASSSCVVKARKLTPTPNVDDIDEDESSNHSVITSDGIVDITDDGNVLSITPTPSMPDKIFITEGVSCNGRSTPKTTRSTMSATKKKICQLSDGIGNKRLKRERFVYLNVLMESRARLGVPVTMEEVPEDLYEIMMNLKEHV